MCTVTMASHLSQPKLGRCVEVLAHVLAQERQRAQRGVVPPGKPGIQVIQLLSGIGAGGLHHSFSGDWEWRERGAGLVVLQAYGSAQELYQPSRSKVLAFRGASCWVTLALVGCTAASVATCCANPNRFAGLSVFRPASLHCTSLTHPQHNGQARGRRLPKTAGAAASTFGSW